MSESESISIKAWVEEHAIGLMFLGLIIFCVIGTVFAFDNLILTYNGMLQFGEMIKQNREYDSEIRSKALYSTDCERLQSGLSSLLSRGANSNSWFPDKNDSALRNGLERYAILC